MKRLIVAVIFFSVFSNFLCSQEWAPIGASVGNWPPGLYLLKYFEERILKAVERFVVIH